MKFIWHAMQLFAQRTNDDCPFISAASKVGLLHYFNADHPHNVAMEEIDPDYDYMTVALLSLILGLGTAFFAIGLRSIRYSAFCCNDYVRSIVTDFA